MAGPSRPKRQRATPQLPAEQQLQEAHKVIATLKADLRDFQDIVIESAQETALLRAKLDLADAHKEHLRLQMESAFLRNQELESELADLRDALGLGSQEQ